MFKPGDPVISRIVTSAPVDPNSAAILAHIPGGTFYDEGNEVGDYQVNLATNATPTHLAGANGWRTYPVAVPGGPGNTAPGATVPVTTPFVIEPASDAHAEVMNTQTCVWTEMYNATWSGTVLQAYAGQQYVMANPFYATFAPTTVSNIPLLGFTNYGEDAALAAIAHPIGIVIPLTAYFNGFIAPATSGEASGTCAAITECLISGDVLRLKASFVCPTTEPMLAFCNQLKTRGAYVTDAASGYGFRMGLDSNGVDQWTTHGYALFAASLTPADFDVVLR